MTPRAPDIALRSRTPRRSAASAVAPRPLRRAFSITELLVVIGIIVLLVGILLPALGAAQQRARAASTSATMEQFGAACESFFQQFGFYPGVVPENILAADPRISGTENAILHLMGGFVRQEDDAGVYAATSGPDWTEIVFNGPSGAYRIKVNRFQIGTGPVIGGKQYAPFYSPKASELQAVGGQYLTTSGGDAFSADGLRLPDLLDAWGQPIIYLRAMRESGPLVGAYNASPAPQFTRAVAAPYLVSVALGEQAKPQESSIFNVGDDIQRNGNLAQVIRHPGFGAANQPQVGSARGRFVLLSAGRDGIFFSQFDGPGSPGAAVSNIINVSGGPKVVEQYDDIVRFGGA